MKSAVGQVWHWPPTDEVILILAVRFVEGEGEDEDGDLYEHYLFDELDLETGRVWRDIGRSIETDDRWERWT